MTTTVKMIVEAPTTKEAARCRTVAYLVSETDRPPMGVALVEILRSDWLNKAGVSLVVTSARVQP